MPRPIPKPPRAEEVLAAAAARPTAGLGTRPAPARSVTRIRAGPPRTERSPERA